MILLSGGIIGLCIGCISFFNNLVVWMVIFIVLYSLLISEWFLIVLSMINISSGSSVMLIIFIFSVNIEYINSIKYSKKIILFFIIFIMVEKYGFFQVLCNILFIFW